MSITLTHPGLPEGCGRFDLLSLFEAAARRHYRLSKTAIALVRHYVRKTGDDDYRKGRICAVWPQVARTARDLDLTPRSINSAERELEDAGFLVRSTGNNGARSGERKDGRVIWAAGINLAPLISRFQELQDRVEAIRLHNRAVDQCKAEIRQINRAIRESEQADLKARAFDILPDGRTARISDLDRLSSIRDALSAVLDMLDAPPREQKTSDGSEENCARKIPPEESSKSCSGDAPPPLPDLKVTPRLAVSLASDDYRSVLAVHGQATWPALVEASYQIALQMGVDQRTWQTACNRFGRERAALCVIVIERNASLDPSHRYHVRQPDGCLAGMVKSALAGSLNLAGLIGAICDREEENSKADHFKQTGMRHKSSANIFTNVTANLGQRMEQET